jgi:DNA-binding transcriptional LysR family regulator
LFSDRLVWLMGRDYILTPGMADRRVQIEAMKLDLSGRSVLENGLERRVALDECCGIIGNPIDGASDGPLLDSLPYSLIAPLVVKQAELAALLPQRLARIFAQDLRLDIVEPADKAAFQIAAIRHSDHGRRAPVAWFFDLLAEVAAGLAEVPRERDSWEEKDLRGSSRTLSPAEDEGPS